MSPISVFAEDTESDTTNNKQVESGEGVSAGEDRITNNNELDGDVQTIDEVVSEKTDKDAVNDGEDKASYEEEMESLLNNQKGQEPSNRDAVIEVRTAEDFYNIRNNLSGSYKLMNDIDLTEVTGEGGSYNTDGSGWIPIGSDSESPFTGTIDGNEFSVIGTYSKYNGGVGGIIGYNSGTIKNLTCSDGTIICANDYTGGIVGVNNKTGKIEDCDNSNTIVIETNNSLHEIYLGGIVGSNHGTIDGCVNTGQFVLSNWHLGTYAKPSIGGIAGFNDLAIANSVNNKAFGIQTSNSCIIGGIVGTSQNGIIGGAVNNAEIMCLTGTNSSLGGICGESTRDSIFKSKNTSTANLILDIYPAYSEYSWSYSLGGICGSAYVGTISECLNGGTIGNHTESTKPSYRRNYFAGGIVGVTTGNVYYSINSGNLLFENNNLYTSLIGGIVGFIMGSSEISNCTNIGDLDINNSNTANNDPSFGGIVGSTIDDAFIFLCGNSGKITVKAAGFSHIGGLVGKLRGDTGEQAMISECYNDGDLYQETTTSNIGSSNQVGMGGLAGTITDNSIIANAYNAGQVYCSRSAYNWTCLGGIAGCSKQGMVGNVYNVGKVSTNSVIGGAIIGYLYRGSLVGSFIGGDWTANNVVLELSDAYSNTNFQQYLYMKPYYYMKKQNTYSEFDFDKTWEMSDGNYDFPILKRCADVDYQKEIDLPVKLVNSSDPDLWIDGYTGDVVDKETGKILRRGSDIPMIKKDISGANVRGIAQQYPPYPAEQSFVVELDGDTLVEGVDYYAICDNHYIPGSLATIRIVGTGKYKGEIVKTYNVVAPEVIDLPAVKISKPKASKKKITVKWKKVSKKDQRKIFCIQIQVATDPGFTNIVKTTTAATKKTSKTIKGLKSKTKYYVRIRAYSNWTYSIHVSGWKSKSVKVK